MCTSIRLIAENGQTLWGRTQDFMMPFGGKTYLPNQEAYDVYVGLDVPVGHVLTGPQVPITFQHQVIGVGIEGKPYLEDSFFFVDGLNDAGLAGGMLYFSDYAAYGETEQLVADGKTPVKCLEYVTWLLANCASIDEVIEKSQHEVGLSTELNNKGEADPLHFMFTDKTGRSIVMEPMAGDGTCRIFENPLGVMTNSPTFDWHLTNLENYAGLTPGILPTKTLANGVQLPSVGNSSGLVGLPGDYSSRSRFVRAAILLSHLKPVADGEVGRDSLFHLFGTLTSANGFQEIDEPNLLFNTHYTVIYDLEKLQMNLSVYENRRIQQLTMTPNNQALIRYKIDYDQDVKAMLSK